MGDLAHQIRLALNRPAQLCAALGLEKGAKRQAAGMSICCPVHGDRNPSCSVTVADGTIRVKCFACDFTGDALTLIGVAKGLDLRRSFREVLAEACRIAGRQDLLDELERGPGGAPRAPVPNVPSVPAVEKVERGYPAAAEVSALWTASQACAEDPQASAMLAARGIDPGAVDRAQLARCFRRDIARDRLPRWASYQGQTWRDTGHRLLLRVFDADGAWRSVRAWRVGEGSSPKRLPPGGFKAAGLVLANVAAQAMLRGEPTTRRVVITEGEPDFVVRALATRHDPVIGIGSGSWSDEFAARIPYGAEVIVRTHRDRAGDGYAVKVLESVRHRAQVYRLVIDEEGEAA